MIVNRAETPEQKREVMERFLAAWNKVPTLRFGQLLKCVYKDKDIFNIEDMVLISDVEEWVDK